MNNFKESNEIVFFSFSDVLVQDFMEGVTEDVSDDAVQFKHVCKTTITVSTCKLSPTNISLRELTDDNLSEQVAEKRNE